MFHNPNASIPYLKRYFHQLLTITMTMVKLSATYLNFILIRQ